MRGGSRRKEGGREGERGEREGKAKSMIPAFSLRFFNHFFLLIWRWGWFWPFGFPFFFFFSITRRYIHGGRYPRCETYIQLWYSGDFLPCIGFFPLLLHSSERQFAKLKQLSTRQRGGRRSKKRGSGFEGTGVRRYNRKPRGIPYCFYHNAFVNWGIGVSDTCSPCSYHIHGRKRRNKKEQRQLLGFLYRSVLSHCWRLSRCVRVVGLAFGVGLGSWAGSWSRIACGV